MPDRYLRTGGGSVNWNSTGSWSATSGGATGASFPVAGDNVFMDANSGAGTLTVNVNSACADFNATGYTGTLAGTGTVTCSGNWIFGTGMTVTNTTRTTFNATTTGKTITSNGKSFGAITFDGVGGGWTLADALSTVSSSLVVTNGAFSDGGFSITTTGFSSSNSNTRSITKTGNWTLTSTGTILDFTTTTNLTLPSFTGSLTCNNASATARTIATSIDLPNLDVNVSAGSGTFTTNLSGTLSIKSLDWTGFTGTWAGNTVGINGNLTFNSSMTLADNTTGINLIGTGTQTITSNGAVINRPVQINKASGAAVLADAINTGTRGLTVLLGTFTDNGFNVTGLTLSSNSTGNTRTINKSGTWTATGTGSCLTLQLTGLTLNDTAGSFVLNNSSATARSIFLGSGSTGASKNIQVTAGTGSFTTSFGLTQTNLDFTGFAGTWVASSINLTGNLTLASGMTITDGNNPVTFNGTAGTQNITSNGAQLNRPVTVDGVGGTLSLADDLNIGTRGVTVTNGTFTLNDKNITSASSSSSNSNVRTINMGSGTWEITGNNTIRTPWQFANSTNLTFNKGTATIKFTDTTSNKKDFNNGGLNYYKLWLAGSSSGVVFMGGGSGTIDTLKVDADRTLNFSVSGGVLSVAAIDFGSSSGHPITLQADTAGSTWNIKNVSGGVFSTDYLSVTDSVGTDGMKWFAGKHSVNGGNNSGWAFDTPQGASQGFFA